MTTIAIIDFAHCGTTMCAGIFEIFGIPMVNDRFQPIKREDWEIMEALQKGEEAFAEVVRRRDAEHKMWGFKFPGAWKFASAMRAHLQDPVYLAIWKDPISVTRRRFGTSNRQWLRKCCNTCRQFKRSMNSIYASDLPVHTLSYHEAIVTPGQFVRHLAELAGTHPTAQQLDRATSYIQPSPGDGRRAPYPDVTQWL